MVHVFIGSEALAAGKVTRYELSRHHVRVLPNVYAPRRAQLTLLDRTVAAWLWSKRRGVVTGLAASALHGARWVKRGVVIELNLANNKSPAGVLTRSETLLDDEIAHLRGMAVTTVERTAFDLARRLPSGRAVQRLDALVRATDFRAEDVLELAQRHRGARDCLRIPHILDLMDAGAQSPQETWLRLLFINAGYPRPQTQIPILGPSGFPKYYLDMGWPEFMVAAEYDGEQHRLDDAQYRGDIGRSEYIERLGWRRIRVLAGDSGTSILRRAELAGLRR